jgi:hypothetical protein
MFFTALLIIRLSDAKKITTRPRFLLLLFLFSHHQQNEQLVHGHVIQLTEIELSYSKARDDLFFELFSRHTQIQHIRLN